MMSYMIYLNHYLMVVFFVFSRVGSLHTYRACGRLRYLQWSLHSGHERCFFINLSQNSLRNILQIHAYSTQST